VKEDIVNLSSFKYLGTSDFLGKQQLSVSEWIEIHEQDSQNYVKFKVSKGKIRLRMMIEDESSMII